MNTATIGQSAGLVWEVLNEAQAMDTKQLRKLTKLKEKEFYAALGWLAREDKLLFEESEDGKELIVSLVQDK